VRSTGSSRPLALALALVMLGAGCASLQNTPQQDYVWEMGRICDGRFRDWYLDRVEADGRYTIRGAPNSVPSPNLPYFDCMREQFAARPYAQWLRQRPAVSGATARPATDPAALAIERRVWSVGDEWSYRWESSVGKGTFVWTVARFEMVEGVDSVVVKAGRREIFYRRSDGAHVLDKVDGGVVIRNVPPVAVLAFPLRAGRPWALDYTRERPEARQTDDVQMDCRADAPAAVTVPAGTFAASHVTCVNRRIGATSFELWYAPEVGNSVKEQSALSSGIRVRELVSFKLATRAARSLD